MPEVKPIPDGYTAITPYLIVENAAGFLDFLANAFGAVERMRIPMPQGGWVMPRSRLAARSSWWPTPSRPAFLPATRKFISTSRTSTPSTPRR